MADKYGTRFQGPMCNCATKRYSIGSLSFFSRYPIMDTRIALVNDPRGPPSEKTGSEWFQSRSFSGSIDSETLSTSIHRFDIDPWSLPILRSTKSTRNGASQRALKWFSRGRENCRNWVRCVFCWPTIPAGSENNAKIRPSGLILRSLHVKRSHARKRGLNTAIGKGACLECEGKYLRFAVRRDIFR